VLYPSVSLQLPKLASFITVSQRADTFIAHLCHCQDDKQDFKNKAHVSTHHDFTSHFIQKYWQQNNLFHFSELVCNKWVTV